MFSFLQQKGSMLDSRVEINNEVKKLTDAADTSLSSFGFLFKSNNKQLLSNQTTTIGYQNSAFSVANMVASNSCRSH